MRKSNTCYLFAIIFSLFIYLPAFPQSNFDNLSHLWGKVEGKRNRSSSYDVSGGNNDFIIMKPKQVHTLCDLQNISGIVQRIWFTFNTEDSLYLQNIKISMTFDGEKTVDQIPIGMFTGIGPWRVNDICTPVLNIMRSHRYGNIQKGTGLGSFNIHFPMPFSSNVKIEMTNDTSSEICFFYYVDYLEISHQDPLLLFHANYNIQPPTINDSDVIKQNYSLLNLENYQGKYIGTILCVESHPNRAGKWYEGDDVFIVDDESKSTVLHGTGTEDYFGMAWGFHRPYQTFDHGVSHFEKGITDHDRFYDGRFVTYRFHINDPIVFHKSIKASIETGHANDCNQHYESVVIWFGKKNR